jgi:ribosomal protein S18 acetylase RimI-like enzyme
VRGGIRIVAYSAHCQKGWYRENGISSLEDEIFAYEVKMGVTIRRATDSDLDALVRLWKELADYHADLAPEFELAPQAEDRFRDHLAGLVQDQYNCVLLAEDEGHAIGFIIGAVQENPPVFLEKSVGHIGSAVVTTDCRRRGVGTLLLAEIRRWFRERGVRYIHLSVAAANPAGIGFWRKMGFQDSMIRMRGEVK